MVGTIIYLIILGLIIRKVLKDRKRKPAASAARSNVSVQTKSSARGKVNTRNEPVQAYQSAPPADYQKQMQMRELKHRLEQKYKSAPRPMKESQRSTYSQNMNYKETKKENSILQSAIENVAENDIDLMKETDKKWHETVKAPLSKTEEDTDVIKQVYDLIAVGYSGNLHFERDFLSEGMDMINRVGMAQSSVELLDFSVEGKF